ncbi:MAG: phytanoyl-CoA dioxygenase family protein [Actinobacteria bacterium]|nr:phytanoyl-CoA dioxygenase family protein [Actinomycetota bacterium]
MLSDLAERGYSVVEGVLTREEAAAKRAELTAVLDRTPTGRNEFEGYNTRRVYALFAKTRAFDGPATHPLLQGVLDRVLGPHQLSAPVGIQIGPGEKAQVLHRDDAVYPLPRPHAEVVLNTMWPFDDFTVANGATRFVPGQSPLGTRALPGGRRRDHPGRDAGRIGHLLRGPPVPRRRRQQHRPAPARSDPRVRGLVAASPGDPPAGGPPRGRPHAAAAAPGAARLQHLSPLRRLRRRPPPAQKSRYLRQGINRCHRAGVLSK